MNTLERLELRSQQLVLSLEIQDLWNIRKNTREGVVIEHLQDEMEKARKKIREIDGRLSE
jgi:hypothetical protein